MITRHFITCAKLLTLHCVVFFEFEICTFKFKKLETLGITLVFSVKPNIVKYLAN